MFHARNRLYHRVRTCKTRSWHKTKETKTSKQTREERNNLQHKVNPVRFIHFLFLQSDENIKITARNFCYFRAIWLMTNFHEYENLHPVHSRRLSNMNDVYLHFVAQNSPIIYPMQLNGEPVSRSLHHKIRFRKTKPKINQRKSRRESKTLFHRRHHVIFKLPERAISHSGIIGRDVVWLPWQQKSWPSARLWRVWHLGSGSCTGVTSPILTEFP